MYLNKPKTGEEKRGTDILLTYLFDFHVYIQVYDLNKHASFPKCPPQQPPLSSNPFENFFNCGMYNLNLDKFHDDMYIPFRGHSVAYM